MIKLFRLDTPYWLIVLLTAIAIFFMAAASIHAQESPEEKAQRYGITFPIAELGNCGSISECRTYCEDPINANSCINYAKSKGFYNEEKVDPKKEQILEKAKEVLGCDSYQSCQAFCSVPSNYEKCDSFAKDEGLAGGHTEDPSETRVLAKAKEFLGCDSLAGCLSLCAEEENHKRCSEFAKTVGLRGGERQVGPGGCTSESTCKAFCSDPQNYQLCAGFHAVNETNFVGPGGCNSEQSCRAYCSQNKDQCQSLVGPQGSPPPGYNMQEMCNKTPNCSWTGNTCQCGFYGETKESQNRAKEYASYCQANPDKCRIGPGGYPIPEEKAKLIEQYSGGAGEYQDYKDYCQKYPDRCKSIEDPSKYQGGYDPAAQCAKYGCSWTDNTCQCSSKYYPSPTPGITSCPQGQYIAPGGYCVPSSETYSPQPAATSYPTATYHPTATYQPTYDPATECAKQSGCSWTGSTCQCSSSGANAASTPQPTSTTTSTPPPTQTSTTTESSGDSSGGSTTSCPDGYYLMDGNCIQGVQGVTAERSLFQLIIDWLKQ